MAFDQGGTEGATTKSALKKSAVDAPHFLYLYSTSAFGGFSGYAVDLPTGLKFNVVGPDPYTSRKWYATVENVNGKIKVS